MSATILRDAPEWDQNHMTTLQMHLDEEDLRNIQHIENCPGCPRCQQLMEFYSGCSVCNRTGHKEALSYDPETGEYTCFQCLQKPAA